MQLNKKFEDILICPMTGEKLSWLTNDELATLNRRILQGEIFQRNGSLHPHALQAALKTADGIWFYPVQDDIYYLLPALALSAIASPAQDNLTQIKAQVKSFYDDFGWQAQEGGYQDAIDSEDLRAVSQNYIEQCHLRLKKYLPNRGKYLLDVASGPVQYPSYLTYSENFDYRICADISLQALLEAKKKLKDKGIYLLCDITQLPLKENSIDGVVSLHTLYHVPKDEQLKAFTELYRVLVPGGRSVVVYSWGRNAFLMNVTMLPFKLYSLFKRQLSKQGTEKSLYFHAYNYRWFCREIKAHYPTTLYSWRSVNVPFLKTYTHANLGGKCLLKAIFYLEERFSTLMGRIGAYPMFVSEKK